MTPRFYLDEVVKPLHTAFEADRKSLPNLYASVTTAYHTVDYISASCGARVLDVTGYVLNNCNSFKIVYSVAIAHKHVKVDNGRAHKGMSVDDIRSPGVRLAKIRGKLATMNGRLLTIRLGFHIVVDGVTVELHGPLRQVIRYFDENLSKIEREHTRRD